MISANGVGTSYLKIVVVKIAAMDEAMRLRVQV
jgi:hypothetical protein